MVTSLEAQTNLSSKFAVLRPFVGDVSERVGAVDTEIRRARQRMVEDIRCIETNLQASGFGELDRLAHRCVEAPSSW